MILVQIEELRNARGNRGRERGVGDERCPTVGSLAWPQSRSFGFEEGGEKWSGKGGAAAACHPGRARVGPTPKSARRERRKAKMDVRTSEDTSTDGERRCLQSGCSQSNRLENVQCSLQWDRPQGHSRHSLKGGRGGRQTSGRQERTKPPATGKAGTHLPIRVLIDSNVV